MPNWVYNRLKLTGLAADVGAFVERVRSSPSEPDGEPTVLDFERMIPVPEELRGNQETDPDDPHGFPKWRTWAVEHWGTKWNAWYPSLEGNPDDGEVTYSFQTAWTPPDKWLAKASTEFPTLEFRHEYVEEMGHFAGRGLWRAGDLIEEQELEPAEIEWAREEDDGGDEQDEEPPAPPADIGEPLEEEAVHRAAWLVESVIELGMNAQRRRRMSADAQSWVAAVSEHVGNAARCARLIAAAAEAHGDSPEAATDPGGRPLLRLFSAHLAAVGAEAIHAAAWFRLWNEGGIDREAREKELAEALELALEGDDRASTGTGPTDWLLWVVRHLGEAGDAAAAAERVRLGHETPEWVEENHDSAADAARFAFGLLAAACIEAVALFAPDDLKPEEIEQPSFWDEIRSSDERSAS